MIKKFTEIWKNLRSNNEISALLAPEISDGLINKLKLFQKIEAFLEMINSEMNAFDPRTGEKVRMKFDDSLIVSFKNKKEKKKIKIVSPRLKNGKYFCKGILFIKDTQPGNPELIVATRGF